MNTTAWIEFEGYEGRLDANYGGAYRSAGIKYPYVERARTWDIVRIDGEPVGGIYRSGTFTVVSRGYDMMRKAHEEAAAYRLHFKRCAGVGVCADIGHPGGPRRSSSQALRGADTKPAPRVPADLPPAASRPILPASVQQLGNAPEWMTILAPDLPAIVRTVSPRLDLAVVSLTFRLWDGPPLGMAQDCNKRGGRIMGSGGELSCAEVEIVKRLRLGGWNAAWFQSFRCGRQRWGEYIANASDLPVLVQAVQTHAGSSGGHPDVLAWHGNRVVAIESKGPGDRLKPSQITWFERALGAGIQQGDVGIVEWRVRT